MIRLADIAAIADIAHANDALLLVDNTVATPVAQHPIRLGADIVVISLTKYIAGHHDVLGGVIIFAEEEELAERVMRLVRIGGGVLSPMNCWLAARGLQSLSLARTRTQPERAWKSPAFWRNILRLSASCTRTTPAIRNMTWRCVRWQSAAG